VKSWQAIAVIAVSVALGMTLTSNVDAQSKPTKVGSVLDIDGPRLMTNRHKEGSWFQAYPSMATDLGEKMKSDAETTATLEFTIGGRAVISPGTEIEIVGQREIDTVGNKVVVKSGKMWAKIDRQNSQLQIQTSGGTMGIEGTEFIVEVDGEETDLSCLEGSIAVTSADGKTERIRGGGAARFGKRGIARRELAKEVREALATGEPGAARELLLLSKGFHAKSRGSVRFALARGRGQGARAFRSPALVCGPQGRLARKRAAGPQRRWPRRQKGVQVQPVSGLTAQGASPSFSWSPVSGASKYSVVLSSDADGEQPIWSAVTNSTSISYPAYGPDLAMGQTYHWMVLPLNSDGSGYTDDGGELCGASTYTAAGHTAVPAAIEGLAVDGTARPLKASWRALGQAASYQLAIAADPGFSEVIWAESTPDSTYIYPAAARGLEAGSYYLRVDAFDEFGVRMGSSPGQVFSTVGWTSLGAQP
jgi:hypothetical protein